MVTDQNKEYFIKLKCDYIAQKSASKQLSEIKRGFCTIVDSSWISHFSLDEFEAQICGKTIIDLKEWKANSQYKGFKTQGISPVIRNFWKVMKTYDQEQLGRILQFCTGSNRLPLGGFAELESESGQKSPFTIQAIDFTKSDIPFSNMPKAHTCFNRLDLPRYPSYDEMKAAIDFIANNEIIGFGIEE